MEQQVLYFPYLNKIYEHTLILSNIVISEGVAKAMKSVFKVVPHLLHHLYLDSNSMSPKALNPLLEGLLFLSGRFKTLTIQFNDLNEHSVDLIS